MILFEACLAFIVVSFCFGNMIRLASVFCFISFVAGRPGFLSYKDTPGYISNSNPLNKLNKYIKINI